MYIYIHFIYTLFSQLMYNKIIYIIVLYKRDDSALLDIQYNSKCVLKY